MKLIKDFSKKAKYPLALFFILVVSKLIYIIVESGYNYKILTTLTNATVVKEDIDTLNTLGHTISSVGLTLLLVPLFYFFLKNRKDSIKYSILALSCVISFFAIKELLNVAVDTIVEQNSDKRHNAYYANIFKYGILNNHFAYNSFISNEKISNHNLSINDKILIINTFLVTFADENLIQRLKKKGGEKVAALYLNMDNKEYEKRYKQVKELSAKMLSSYEDFDKQRKVLKDKTSKLNDETTIKNAYKKLEKTMNEKFKSYKKATSSIDEKIKKATTVQNLQWVHSKLKKYFKYQTYTKAKNEYKRIMNEKLGHYVKPDRWLDKDGQLSIFHIEKIIKEEIQKSVIDRLGGIPSGLNGKEFLNNLKVKSKVALELKKKGILISKKFNYSYAEFKKYFLLSMERKTKDIQETFYTKVEEKIGKNDLKLSDNWEDFVKSNFITNQIKEKLPNVDKTTLQKIQTLLISKNIGNFKNSVYIPTIQHEIQKRLYSIDEFNTKAEAIKAGNEAIKLLYIPPFALGLSMVALLLNIITVAGMLCVFLPISKNNIFIAKTGMFITILSLPFLFENKSMTNALLKQVISSNDILGYYISFIDWLKFYEVLNTYIHN